ncbi:MAG: hypothetical protein KGK34_06980 [Chloroflexota bacterium]|nr:hypothetical protein [Chloroflexota bacterium]
MVDKEIIVDDGRPTAWALPRDLRVRGPLDALGCSGYGKQYVPRSLSASATAPSAGAAVVTAVELHQPLLTMHVMTWLRRDEAARAEMTLTLAHGQRELRTRVLLRDGRILEQRNPGVPEVDDGWRDVGRFDDLDVMLNALRREGWAVRSGSRADQPQQRK